MSYQQYIEIDVDIHCSADARQRSGAVLLWRQRVERALVQLEATGRQLEALEAQHEQFMQHYYATVGDHCEELARLERELGDVQAQSSGAAPSFWQSLRWFVPAQTEATPAHDADTHDYQMARHLKQLYRSMVKECHPDSICEPEKGTGWMQRLNDAYAQRSLAALWRVRCEWRAGSEEALSPEKALAHWQQEWQQIQALHARVTQRLEELRQSHTHALMERALQLKLCGQDFMQIVQESIAQQIEQKKRGLVIAKIKRNSARLTQGHADAV